jgi:hypothetical protein
VKALAKNAIEAQHGLRTGGALQIDETRQGLLSITSTQPHNDATWHSLCVMQQLFIAVEAGGGEEHKGSMPPSQLEMSGLGLMR